MKNAHQYTHVCIHSNTCITFQIDTGTPCGHGGITNLRF